MAKDLSHFAPVRCVAVFGANGRRRLDSTFDLLMTTPPQLQRLLQTQEVFLSRLRTMVLDEVDTLLDDSFRPFTGPLLARVVKHSLCCPGRRQFGIYAVLPFSIVHFFFS